MWKYILIVAFLLFAIREINLMNESLYIEPTSHKIITQDNTVIGKVVEVVEKKIHQPKPYTPSQTDKNSSKPAQPKSNVTHPAAAQSNTTQTPSLNIVENEPAPGPETDTKTPAPSLAKIEKEAGDTMQIHPSATQNPVSATDTSVSSRTSPVISHSTPLPAHPDSYEDAQKRVMEILRQMKASR